jgi:hypothetical protein
MRRFAQKAERNIPGEEPSLEKEQEKEFAKKLEEIRKSEADVIKFCEDLKAAGSGLKQAATKIPQPYFLISTGLSSIGDKFIEIGSSVVTAINAKKGVELSLNVAGFVAPLYQPTSKTPGLKRYIPFVGDYVNYRYTKTLTYQKDLIDPIERIFAPFKCDKNHPATNAPVMRGIVPNFFDHPELDDQYRAKTKAVSDLSMNLGAQLQNLEALLAYIATAFGQIEAVAAIRAAGGLVQTVLMLLNIAFSPNTADLAMYGAEGFEGGGIDPKNPFASLNKIPGISKYIKKYEAKPIAEEAQAASEKTLQHFTLLELYEPNLIKLKDKFGEEKVLITGEKWPKWNITITYVGRDHAEYKDKNGNKYSVRFAAPAFSLPEENFGDTPGTIFYKIMQDAANLPNSGAKGNLGILLSKKISDIMSLMFQLKNKYPWIGDTKNSKWINLQSDILTHNKRPIKRTKVKRTTPTTKRPGISPVNSNQTPGTTDLDREMKRREDLPSL